MSSNTEMNPKTDTVYRMSLSNSPNFAESCDAIMRTATSKRFLNRDGAAATVLGCSKNGGKRFSMTGLV